MSVFPELSTEILFRCFHHDDDLEWCLDIGFCSSLTFLSTNVIILYRMKKKAVAIIGVSLILIGVSLWLISQKSTPTTNNNGTIEFHEPLQVSKERDTVTSLVGPYFREKDSQHHQGKHISNFAWAGDHYQRFDGLQAITHGGIYRTYLVPVERAIKPRHLEAELSERGFELLDTNALCAFVKKHPDLTDEFGVGTQWTKGDKCFSLSVGLVPSPGRMFLLSEGRIEWNAGSYFLCRKKTQ